jgi:type I restriction enzyme M protein
LAKADHSATSQTTIAFPGAEEEHLDIAALETWLWDAACVIRGTTDAPKFKDFLLPLIFFKRLSDVFDDEFATHVEEYGDDELAQEIAANLAAALEQFSSIYERLAEE